jgi:hypothetical protein
MKKTLIYLLAIVILISISCSSTRLTSSWSLPDATTQKYNKVLVIGMTGAKDREIRENIENSMAKKLNENSITAVTASSKYGSRTFQKMTEDEAMKMVKDDGFDGVMILALLDKNKERNYTPGRIINTPYAVVHSHWWPNYRVLYDRVYTPGYYTTSTNYELEANFYNMDRNELQYSAQAQSFDPGSAATLAGDFSKVVIDDMTKKGLISK